MTKGKEYYQFLIKRYLNNDCTPAETNELLDYIQQDASHRLLLSQMSELYDRTMQEAAPQQSSEWSQKIRETLSNNIYNTYPTAKVIPLYKIWLPRVAAAILVIVASITFYQFNSNRRFKPGSPTAKSIPAQSNTPATEVLPGGDKALLTLGDGTVIVLDETKNGTLGEQGGTSVDKRNGLIVYDASGTSAAGMGEITYNTIATPRGGQYQVILPDGSKVWLNAASSLRFPTVFTGATRNVELEGEGYFEIEKNAALPFHVQVNKMDIEVLGTHFNVMAYSNETTIKTTLLEGAVKINSGSTHKTLRPGQQGRMENASGNINIAVADTDEAVAWKNGYFHFTNEDIQSIMRQFSRWYDIEVRYEGKVYARPFSGEVSRKVNLSQALKLLEFANVKFRIDNKSIVVLY